MAKAALVLLVFLVGCTSVQERADKAAEAKGRTQASTTYPDLPAACTAKVGRVKAGGEPWVVTMKRWEIVADNRDRQAVDCAAWGAEMKTRTGELR